MSQESIIFGCNSCGKKLQVGVALAGKHARCAHCKALCAVPAQSGSSPAASAAPHSTTAAEQPSPAPPVSSLTAPLLVDSPSDSSNPTVPSLPESAEQEDSHDTHGGMVGKAKGTPNKWDFLAPAQGPDELGRLGPYRVLGELGAGGMGVVFVAEDVRLQRSVALKVMLPRVAATIPSARQRFLREARATAAIEFDHIVTIYHVGEDRDVPFIAMQLLKGESLEKRIKRDGKLSLPEVLRIGREIASALAMAHERGLVHRDIKPSNIWLEKDSGRVKLLDFGLALDSAADVNLTQTGAIVGTPAYMAPEQAEASHGVDHRCDLFSLGCVLYRMSTGRPAFTGSNTVSLLLALQMHNPDPPMTLDESLPPALSGLIMQLLAKKPDRRPKTAREVVDRIKWIEEKVAKPAIPGGNEETITFAPTAQPAWPTLLPDSADTAGKPVVAITAGVPAVPAPGSRSATAITTPSNLPRAIPLGPPTAPGQPAKPKPAAPRISRTLPVPLPVLIGVPALLGVGIIALLLSGIFYSSDSYTEVAPKTGTGKNSGNGETGPDKGKKNTTKPKPAFPTFPVDPIHRLHYQYSPFKNFGLTVPVTSKKLTYSATGISNSIVVKVDGSPLFFGTTAKGQWLAPQENQPPFVLGEPLPDARSKNVWQTTGSKIQVTQVLDIIPGKQLEEVGPVNRRWILDTCLVAWMIENHDKQPHQVGLRLVLDTMIGNNDGVPFAVPGLSELVTTQGDYEGANLPAFLQALEFPILENPGTVAHLSLKVGDGLEPPSRVSLTHWQEDQRDWTIPLAPIGADSCVVLYWDEKELKPGEKRYLAFTYGLGHVYVDSRKKGYNQLGLTMDGDFEAGKEFTLLAYVSTPEPGQKLKLELSKDLELIKGKSQQVVPQPTKGSKSLVTWTIHAREAGRFQITIGSSTGINHQRTIFISPPGEGKSLNRKKVFGKDHGE